MNYTKQQGGGYNIMPSVLKLFRTQKITSKPPIAQQLKPVIPTADVKPAISHIEPTGKTQLVLHQTGEKYIALDDFLSAIPSAGYNAVSGESKYFYTDGDNQIKFFKIIRNYFSSYIYTRLHYIFFNS